MATKWFSDAKNKRKWFPDRCQNCLDGFHLGAGKHKTCIERACHCWCRLPSVHPAIYAKRQWGLPPEMKEVFTTLREHSVLCRTTSQMKVVWKPRPVDLPDDVHELLRYYAIPFARVLVPSIDIRIEPRPLWYVDGISACIDCERSVALTDPLGQPRHTWCGWLAGPPQEPT